MEAKQLLALDVGQQRTGLARASTVAKIPEPLSTIPTSQLPAIAGQLVKDHSASAIVIGLPRNLQGQDTGQTAWVRQWAEAFKQSVNVPLYWQDEAATTQLAEQQPRSAAGPDAEAAAIILGDFLSLDPAKWEDYRL